MFSLRAREKLRSEGWGARAFCRFVVDGWRESLENIHAYGELAREMRIFAVAFTAVILPCLLAFYLPDPGIDYFVCLAATSAGVWLCTAGSLLSLGLMRRPDGVRAASVGPANYLTLIRFYLIAPMVVLLCQGRLWPSLAVFAVIGLSDIADGVVARRRGEQTEFGVVMDPLADVFSTAAVFAALYALDVVPGWLFALLMARYGMLIVGSLVLFLLVGPIQFRATIPGKVVGVLQAVGITVIVVGIAAGPETLNRIGVWLFPFLGICFASIVVSQAIIAVRVRNATPGT